jgi:hypothetical protein
MKKQQVILAAITSIFVITVALATYFKESIDSLMAIAGINFSTMLPNPDFKILLYFSLVGIVCIHRSS